MKKCITRSTSLVLALLIMITLIPFSAKNSNSFAVNTSMNYWEHSEPTRTLYYTGGSQLYGDDVKWFQCAINNLVCQGDCNGSFLYTSKLDVDGYFGNASKTALLAFQKKYNLTQDGYFGPSSLSTMRSKLRGYQPQIPVTTEATRYVGPSSGTLTYYNSSAYRLDHNNSSIVSSISKVGSGSFNININANDNGDRSCTISVYNSSGKKISTFTIYQNGVIVRIERITRNEDMQRTGGSLYKYCVSSLGQDKIRYRITSNRKVNIKIHDMYGSYICKTVGSDRFDTSAISQDVDVWFPDNPTTYARALWVTANAGNKVAYVNGNSNSHESYYQPLKKNYVNGSNQDAPLGTIYYRGYGYKIVTQDDLPPDGLTTVLDKTTECTSFDLSQFASLELEGEDYHSGKVLGWGTLFQVMGSAASSFYKVKVNVTLYTSKSNIRYATILIADTALQNQLQNKAGYTLPFVNMDDGRKMQLFLDTGHRTFFYQYAGYINCSGKLCIAFRGLAQDKMKIRSGSTTTTMPWFAYGYDRKHTSPFETMQAPDEYKELFNLAIDAMW